MSMVSSETVDRGGDGEDGARVNSSSTMGGLSICWIKGKDMGTSMIWSPKSVVVVLVEGKDVRQEEGEDVGVDMIQWMIVEGGDGFIKAAWQTAWGLFWWKSSISWFACRLVMDSQLSWASEKPFHLTRYCNWLCLLLTHRIVQIPIQVVCQLILAWVPDIWYHLRLSPYMVWEVRHGTHCELSTVVVTSVDKKCVTRHMWWERGNRLDASLANGCIVFRLCPSSHAKAPTWYGSKCDGSSRLAAFHRASAASFKLSEFV